MKRLLILAALVAICVGCNRHHCRKMSRGAPWRCGSQQMMPYSPCNPCAPCNPCMPCDPCSSVSTGAGFSGCSTCSTPTTYEQGVILGTGGAINPPTMTPVTPGS
jgi:hypothetical protein